MPKRELRPRPIIITRGRFDFPVKPNPLRVSRRFGEAPHIVFDNQTLLYAQVNFFEDDLILDAKGKPLKSVPAIAPGGKSDPLTVNTRLGEGTYSYQVKLYDEGRTVSIEASGRSRPEVEIQR